MRVARELLCGPDYTLAAWAIRCLENQAAVPRTLIERISDTITRLEREAEQNIRKISQPGETPGGTEPEKAITAAESAKAGDSLDAQVYVPKERVQETADAAVKAAVKALGVQQQPPAPAAPIGLLGGQELADALGIHPTRRDAFFRQLTRWRLRLGDGNWDERKEPRHKATRFVYRADSPTLQALAARYREPQSG